MPLHITVSTVIQTAMTKRRSNEISAPPTWSNNHTLSNDLFYNTHNFLIRCTFPNTSVELIILGN
jgi:hypothetical protein